MSAVVERIAGEWIVFHLEPNEAECVLKLSAVRTVPPDERLQPGAWGWLTWAPFTECNAAPRDTVFTFVYDPELTRERTEQIADKVAALRARGRATLEVGHADAED